MLRFSIESLFHLTHYRHAVIFQDCQYPWEVFNKIHDYLMTIHLGKIGVGIPSGAHLINPELISIGKGTLIEPGAYIKGPCIIGDDCCIRQGAYIRGDVIVGNGCVIGHDSELKNSILLNGAKAAHFAYVGDSLLGNEVNLGAGVKLSNVRMDHAPISIIFEGQRISTGRKKLGAILGDGTQMGCNSVSNPGVITGKNVHCYPCLNISGYIPENAKIKPSSSPLIHD